MPTRWHHGLGQARCRKFLAPHGGIALEAIDRHSHAFILPLLSIGHVNRSADAMLAIAAPASLALDGILADIAADRAARPFLLRVTILCLAAGASLAAAAQTFAQLLGSPRLQRLGFGRDRAGSIAVYQTPNRKRRLMREVL